MNIPNVITLTRIALVPVFAVLMNLDAAAGGGDELRFVALAVFLLACSTDWMDGYLARRWDEVTSFGKFMDPLADKLLVAAALFYFVGEGTMASWIALTVLAREFIVSSLRMVASGSGVVIAAGFSGKVKTFIQMLLISVILTPLFDLRIDWLGGARICDICAWLILSVTLWSGVDYLWRYRGILKTNLK